MKTSDYIKSNLGLIILAISIIIGSLILTETLNNNSQIELYEKFIKADIELSGSASQLPFEINTNGNDVTYNTELNLGKGEKLIIKLSDGNIDRIEGEKIYATYFYVGKILIVEFEQDGLPMYKHYTNPIKWENEI